MKRVHIFISGDVIGVGFRAWTLRNAQKLELNGFVRNMDYKTVEVVLEGEKEKVTEMVAICKKGPDIAWVENVKIVWEEATEEFTGFEIR